MFRDATGMRIVCGLAVTFCLAVSSTTAEDIVRVEEDWELVVANPDPNSIGPQVTCVFSHLGHLRGLHAAVEFNHQSLPDFSAGGLQLQLWHGQYPVSSHKFPHNQVMRTPNETVRWTQCIYLSNDNLVYEITDGSSTTWGTFGSQGYLRVANATTVENLNNYTAQVSVDNSGIGYAANRVASLVLKRVRRFTASGDVLVDDNPQVVHQTN